MDTTEKTYFFFFLSTVPSPTKAFWKSCSALADILGSGALSNIVLGVVVVVADGWC